MSSVEQGSTDLYEKNEEEELFEEHCRVLIETGSDPNSFYEEDIPHLAYAVRNRYFDAVKFLVQNGADVNLPYGRDRRTAIYDVFFSRDFSNPDSQDDWERGRMILKYLLVNGARLDVRDSFLRTPLHMASLSGREDLVEMLLKAGADITVEDHQGNSALHLAAKNGYWKVVRLLLEKGAPGFYVNKENRTAWQEALLKPREKEVLAARKVNPHFYPDVDYEKTLQELERFGYNE